MVHVGQEATLGPVRCFGRFLGDRQGQRTSLHEFFEVITVQFHFLPQLFPFEQVADALAGDFDIDRFGDVVGGTQGQAGTLGFDPGKCGNEDHGDRPQRRRGHDPSAGLVAIHLRHHHVEQDQIGWRLRGHGQTHRSRGGDLQIEVRFQRGAKCQ